MDGAVTAAASPVNRSALIAPRFDGARPVALGGDSLHAAGLAVPPLAKAILGDAVSRGFSTAGRKAARAGH